MNGDGNKLENKAFKLYFAACQFGCANRSAKTMKGMVINTMSSRITVKDLARLCKVSIGTVDRAINDRGGINPETRRKILETAEEYGFVKNQNAQSLSSGRSKLLGVIMTNLKNEFLTTLLSAIEAEAALCGYSAIIMLSNYSPERELECVERMRAMNIAGLIVFPVISDPSHYRRMIKLGTPVITVGNQIEGIPYVGIDDFDAMKRGTEFVLSRGYERLIYVSPLLEKSVTQNISAQLLRRDGFLEAAEGKAELRMIDCYDKYSELLSELKEARSDSEDKKTALICTSDAYTIACLPLVGKRLGIMGFDRLTTIGTLIPSLAGIVYPAAEIGKAAVRLMLKVDRDAPMQKILFESEVFGGETV